MLSETAALRSPWLERWLRQWPLLPILGGALLLRTWNLQQNGFGRTYYAAGVRGQMESWHNFFFNAFDPGGFVSIDKPPLAIWFQVLSAKLLGFQSLAMLLPQVIEGVLAVGIVYHLVQRTFGRGAGLIAAALLALTPISIAVDRSNNTESCLIVFLLLATWAGMRAAETGRLRLLLLAMALAGLGFNVKMGAAIAIVPALGLTYLVANHPRALLRWGMPMTAAGCMLIATSMAWVMTYDFTPPSARPYAGSTQHNSMTEMVLVHNGTSRFMRAFERTIRPDGDEGAATAESGAVRPRLWDDSPTGFLRLLRPHQASQMAWWLPFALAGIFLGSKRASDAGETRARRIAVTVWTGWLAIYGLLFSFAGGPFHTYYLTALAPPLAALAGIAVTTAWRRHFTLAALFLTVIAWQSFLTFSQINVSTHWVVLTAIIALVISFAASIGVAVGAHWPSSSGVSAGVALVALAALPLVAGLSVVLIRPNVAAPVARLGAFMQPAPEVRPEAQERRTANRRKLIRYLRTQRANEKFLLAVPNAIVAAPLIMATGEPVMAIGGYAGLDPILTPDDLARRAKEGQVRFVMLGGFSFTQNPTTHQKALFDWVRANGKLVDEALWSINAGRGGPTYRMQLGGAVVTMARPQLFDLNPR